MLDLSPWTEITNFFPLERVIWITQLVKIDIRIVNSVQPHPLEVWSEHIVRKHCHTSNLQHSRWQYLLFAQLYKKQCHVRYSSEVLFSISAVIWEWSKYNTWQICLILSQIIIIIHFTFLMQITFFFLRQCTRAFVYITQFNRLTTNIKWFLLFSLVNRSRFPSS